MTLACPVPVRKVLSFLCLLVSSLTLLFFLFDSESSYFTMVQRSQPTTATAFERKSISSSTSSMSLDSNGEADENTKKSKQTLTTIVTSSPRQLAYKAPQPSLSLLFSLFSKWDLFVLVLPATIAALAAASIPPFMTIVIGDAYDVFSRYQSTLAPNSSDHAALLQGIGLAALEFCAMGVGALFLSAVMSALWIWVGEKNVMYLRRLVYDSVAGREMEWYDRNTDDKEGAVGAGGLMSQFAS